MPLDVLLIEDNPHTALNFQEMFEDEEYGHKVSVARSTSIAKSFIQKKKFDIAFVDLDLEEKRAGFDVVPLLKNKKIYTVILSGHDEDEYVEKGYGLDCNAYLTKPYELDQIEKIFNNLDRHNDFVVSYRELLSTDYLTKDDFTLKELKKAESYLLRDDIKLFISGETGVGKTALSKVLHFAQFKKYDNYVHVNCAEIESNLLKSELFGAKKGSHSEAKSDKDGRILGAHNGTLHLDEIACLDLESQAKLLTFLDTGLILPLGGEKKDEIKVKAKIICSTNENLEEMVQEKKFREDLYHRIMGKVIEIPALKERRDDIKMFVDLEVKRLNKSKVFRFSQAAREKLYAYNWYGNVREIKSFFKGIAEEKGFLNVTDLPLWIVNNFNKNNSPTKSLLTSNQVDFVRENGLNTFIEKISSEVIEHFYHKNGRMFNRTKNELEITQYHLKKYLKSLGLEK